MPLENTLSQLTQAIRFLAANDFLQGVEAYAGEADERERDRNKIIVVGEGDGPADASAANEANEASEAAPAKVAEVAEPKDAKGQRLAGTAEMTDAAATPAAEEPALTTA